MTSTNAAIGATNVVSLPVPRRRRESDELDFLPAALEIVEKPPSPIGRAIGVTIVVLFCIALGWATFGRVDIVASASGKVIPTGRVKLLQPFETGVVRAINVRDGQSVKAGDVLIELDPTTTAAEEQHIRSDLIAAQLDVARLSAILSEGDHPEAEFHPPAGAGPDLIAMQRQFLARQTEEYHAKLASLDQQKAQKEAEAATVAAMISKLAASEPLIKQRVEILQALADKQLGSKLTYLEALQILTENENELIVQQSRLKEAQASVSSIVETRAQTAAEVHRTLFGELAEAKRKAAEFGEDLVKAERRTKLQLLTAPVDGVVQQLTVHTVGGVVTPAQVLGVVVPSGTTLEVEAMISNRDIGFVHVGQDAQIKVDAFNFARYGLLHAHVLDVSRDSIARDVSSEKANGDVSAADGTNSEPKGEELSYAARFSLDETQLQVEGTAANLSPGMAVTVDIKTGSRRIISYLLSPLMKYKQEILRER